MTFSINCLTDDVPYSPVTNLYCDKSFPVYIWFDSIFHTNTKRDASSLSRRQ